MRTKLKSRLGVLGVVAASVALGGLTTPASAGDGGRRGAGRGGHAQHDPYYAGTLRIGDRRYVVRSDTFVHDEIAYTFKRLGFDAWCDNGRVYVRMRHRHRPIVRWLAGSHGVRSWYEGDCLVIKVIAPSYGHSVGVKKPYQPAWRDRRGAGRRGQSCARPWAGRPYARGSIGLSW